jgi:hypothetical protein
MPLGDDNDDHLSQKSNPIGISPRIEEEKSNNNMSSEDAHAQPALVPTDDGIDHCPEGSQQQQEQQNSMHLAPLKMFVCLGGKIFIYDDDQMQVRGDIGKMTDAFKFFFL